MTVNTQLAFTWAIALVFTLIGCGSGGGSSSGGIAANPDVISEGGAGAPVPDNSANDSYRILLLGNSHVGPIGGIIQTLVSVNQTGKTAVIKLAPGAKFLDERIDDGETYATLTGSQWTHVILQGQKYSMSAGAIYPTSAAELWVKRSKDQGATPILFPEHPQRGNAEEGRMLYDLHKSIAAKELSCVAPIGLAWDEALARNGTLPLHNADGNHASPTGALLTALVFYQIITGELAVALPYVSEFDVDEDTQTLLRQVASDVILFNPPCEVD